jgi:TatA/E family protein of Tat protein translocase
MFGLGFGELVLVLLIALIFIGPKKLPELAKGLGQGIREFQKAAKGFTDSFQDNEDSLPPSSIENKSEEKPLVAETEKPVEAQTVVTPPQEEEKKES